MNFITLILGIFALAAIAGGLGAWYKRSAGKDALELAQQTISMQKEENALQARKIIALQAQLDIKDEIIERLTTDGKNNTREKK